MAHSHENTMLARLGFSDPDRREPWHDIACQYLAQRESVEKLAALLFKKKLESKPIRKFENSDGSALDCVGGWALKDYSFELEKHLGKGYGQYKTTVGFLDVHLRLAFECHGVGRMRPTDKPIRERGWAPATEADLTKDMKLAYEHARFERPDAKMVSVEDAGIRLKPYFEGGKALPREVVPLVELSAWHDCATYQRQEWRPYEERAIEGEEIVVEVKAHQATAGDVIRQFGLYQQYATGPDSGISHRCIWLLATCYPITRTESEALTNAGIKHVQLSPERVMAWHQAQNESTYIAQEV